jgi:phenylacetate-coenzyme A ligase PaaK-like adenylate-forming protein
MWVRRQKRVTRMTPARVRLIQQRRLRRLLLRAGKQSAFYREKYRGIDLARCDLADLPSVRKDELIDRVPEMATDPRITREALDRFLADPANHGRLLFGKYAVCRTSGTQGLPLTVVHNPRSLEVLFGVQMGRGNVGRVGVGEGLRRLWHPARLAGVALEQPFNSSTTSWTHMPAAARAFVDVLRLTPDDPAAIERLNRFRPTAITAYASFLDFLALQKDRLHLAPELRQVVSAAEVLTEAARDSFREAFGVPVLNMYSMAECIFLSSGCHTDPGVHVNADWAILEVVDEDYRPVPPGRPGNRVLVTNLANDVQPFIRYEIGDRVTWAAGPCRCGNRLPRVERIDGRTADYFWVSSRGGYRQLLSFVFKTAFEVVPEVREWQVVQEERNRLRVRLEVQPNTRPDAGRVSNVLKHQLDQTGLGGEVDFEVEFVPRLESDPSTGKLWRIVSRVGPPDDLERVISGREAIQV